MSTISRIQHVFVHCLVMGATFLSLFLYPTFAWATTTAPSQQAMIFQQNNVFAKSSGLDQIDSDPRFLVTLVVQVASSILGIALICYGVYGGYIMMFSNGDPEQVSMGKKAIARAIIGTVIIVSAYSVSRYVGSTLQRNLAPGANNGGFAAATATNNAQYFATIDI